MTETAIRIRGLSKSYRIKHEKGDRPTNLGEAISHKIRHPFAKASHEDFWALNGIDLEINKGDVVGVIGRNGAGKSTLLKVLSRITEPTTGKVELFGRIGSLLEVGTGFHPELTGRENIYLNGAILGMRRPEITRQFDAIVDFAGVERFLDTPVKRYSSGMYVRLAFAVAAHLNPEILIVDEVLAVGDAEFQKKCLGKMQDVAESGRTVLFVSHNMAAVERLCGSVLLLSKGTKQYLGSTATGLAKYTQLTKRSEEKGPALESFRKENLGRIKILKTHIDQAADTSLIPGQPATICFDIESSQFFPSCHLEFGLLDSMGVKLAWIGTELTDSPVALPEGRTTVRCQIDNWPFREGTYFCNAVLKSAGIIEDWIQGAHLTEVVASDSFGTGRTPPHDWGNLILSHRWSTQQ
ncbi:ABC transporter ATP-binding protein [Rhodopirellula sp. SWK7]|uniref:ABC transporter ATP-binding protein n=1 Tax=Rhodopirellula sp. SWK7 TaxID=595460 RepID=UPI0002BEB93C|nr:ABC transporter ATP-binding protein [Rhodopirellula sp. SWK7]EMI42514.1 ABC transporter, ATP-binding protein [Rhodopirellula sp. SWK7]